MSGEPGADEPGLAKKPVRIVKKKKKVPVETQNEVDREATRTKVVDTGGFEVSKDPSLAVPSPKKVKKKKKKPMLEELAPTEHEFERSVQNQMDLEQAQKVRKTAKKRAEPEEEKQQQPSVSSSDNNHAEETILEQTIEKPKKIKIKKKKDKEMIDMEQKKLLAQKEQEEKNANEKEEKNKKGENGEEDDYEDDFENYDDDDFEDEEPSVDAFKFSSKSPKVSRNNQFAPDLNKTKKKQQEKEKAAAGTFYKVNKAQPRTSSSQRSRRSGQENIVRGNFDDFDKMDGIGVQLGSGTGGSKRCQAIKQLIQMQQVKIDIFEQHSLPPWEFYIRTVASGGTHRQTFVQTNDDACEVEIQTESVESRTVSCQGEEFYVETEIDANQPDPSLEEKTNENEAQHEETMSLLNLDKLTELCEVLLEENFAHQLSLAQIVEGKSSDLEVELSANQSIITAQLKSLGLGSRAALQVEFSKTQSQILLVTFGPIEKNFPIPEGSERIAQCSVLCMWDLNVSKTDPASVLVCESSVTKTVMNAGRVEFVIAGSEEGTLYVWDLKAGNKQGMYVYPSYCTAGPRLSESGHDSSIVDLQLVQSSSLEAKSLDGGFQLASLDEEGIICVWTVLIKSEPQLILNEEDDYVRGKDFETGHGSGVFMEGRVKLQQASAFSSFPTAEDNGKGKSTDQFQSSSLATCFAFHPTDLGQVFVASNAGTITRCSRFGAKVSPKVFFPERMMAAWTGLNSGDSSLCIAFHPLLENFFLVGFLSGAISLFAVSCSSPIRTWKLSTSEDQRSGSGFAPLIQVEWSNVSPSQFFAVDANGIVFVWDLEKDDEKPIIEYSPRGVSRGKTIHCTSPISLSATVVKTMAPSLVIVSPAGEIELHELSSTIFSRVNLWDDLAVREECSKLENKFLNL